MRNIFMKLFKFEPEEMSFLLRWSFLFNIVNYDYYVIDWCFQIVIEEQTVCLSFAVFDYD